MEPERSKAILRWNFLGYIIAALIHGYATTGSALERTLNIVARWPELPPIILEFYSHGGFERPLPEVSSDIQNLMNTLYSKDVNASPYWLIEREIPSPNVNSTTPSTPPASSWADRYRNLDYSAIDLLVALGYPLKDKDIQRLLRNKGELPLKEWRSLIRHSVDICSDNLLNRLVHDIAADSPPLYATDSERLNILRQQLASLNILDILRYDTRCLYNVHLGDDLQNILHKLQERKKSLLAEEKWNTVSSFDILADWITSIIAIVESIHRGQRAKQNALQELSLLPARSRFPGGYHTIQRQPGFLDIREQVNRLVREYQERQDVRSEVIQLAGRTGILPFTNKQEALHLIANRFREWLQDIQHAVNPEDLFPFARALGLPNISTDIETSKQLLHDVILRRSYMLSTETEWPIILEETNLLNITHVPTDIQSFIQMLQEYSTQL